MTSFQQSPLWLIIHCCGKCRIPIGSLGANRNPPCREWAIPLEHQIRVLLLPLLLAVSCIAKSFSGTVFDQRGQGYPGVEVRLSGYAGSATTDADGKWKLETDVATLAPDAGIPSIRWVSSELRIDAERSGWARLELIDRLGRRVANSRLIELAIGKNVIPWWNESLRFITLVSFENGSKSAIDARNMFASRVASSSNDTLSYFVAGSLRGYKTFYEVTDTIGLCQFLVRTESAWDTIADSRDGQRYRVVTFKNFDHGNTVQWMSSSLRYKPSHGRIKEVTPGVVNDGVGYSWATATGLPDSCDTVSCFKQVHEPLQGICPDGWNLTSTKDWDILAGMVYDQDARYRPRYGVLESIGAKDVRWSKSEDVNLPSAEVRDFFGLAISPASLHYWLSTPWTDEYNVYGAFSTVWQDFRHNARAVGMQAEIVLDEARKTGFLPVRCIRTR